MGASLVHGRAGLPFLGSSLVFAGIQGPPSRTRCKAKQARGREGACSVTKMDQQPFWRKQNSLTAHSQLHKVARLRGVSFRRPGIYWYTQILQEEGGPQVGDKRTGLACRRSPDGRDVTSPCWQHWPQWARALVQPPRFELSTLCTWPALSHTKLHFECLGLLCISSSI